MDNKKTCDSCGDASCSAKAKNQGENDQDFADRRRLQARLCRIQHKIVVLSGKEIGRAHV